LPSLLVSKAMNTDWRRAVSYFDIIFCTIIKMVACYNFYVAEKLFRFFSDSIISSRFTLTFEAFLNQGFSRISRAYGRVL